MPIIKKNNAFYFKNEVTMAIAPISNSSLDDQLIQSLIPQPNPANQSSVSAANSSFTGALQNLQNNGVANNDLAMLQALQSAETSTKSTGTTVKSTPQVLHVLQETNTATNNLAMLKALQTTYSGGVSDLLQNILNIQDANINQTMLQALQGAGNTEQTSSDATDILDTLLDHSAETNTVDDILDSLIQSSQDSGSATTNDSSILQDLQATDSAANTNSLDDVVLGALLQTDGNNGDFAQTLQALQNMQSPGSLE